VASLAGAIGGVNYEETRPADGTREGCHYISLLFSLKYARPYLPGMVYLLIEAFQFSLERVLAMHSFSQEAIERPYRTLEAARVLRGKADVIEHATANAHEDEIVVAVIHGDLSFGGVWTLAREDMARQVLLVEDEGGWSLLFSPNSTVTHVEERCDELARIATKRAAAMQNWLRRNPPAM
jgi:hypothetical protein